MRVLHLVCPKQLYKAESVILPMLEGSQHRGYDAALCCLVSRESEEIALIDEAGRAGVQAGVLEYPMFLSGARNRDLRERARQAGVDIVHTHDYKSTFVASRTFPPGEFRLVSTCLGLEVDGFHVSVFGALHSRALRRFDFVLAAESEVEGRRGRKLVKRLGDRIAVLPGDVGTIEETIDLEASAHRVYRSLVKDEPREKRARKNRHAQVNE